MSVPPGRECTPEAGASICLSKLGDLSGGRGHLGSYSVCFESDDKKVVNFLGKGKFTPDKIRDMPMIIKFV